MNFPSIRLEGAILTADLLDAIAREDKHSQKPADFGLDPSGKVKDEIASTWASAKALWSGYQAKITALREGQTGVSETRNLFVLPLLALLGYQPEKADAETLNGKSYAISHRDISRDGFPLHIMGWNDSLEKKRTTGGPRICSHALVQEYLNLTEHLYGLITNGRQLRLLRDSSRLIKLSFLDFDLYRIFEEDLYADFAILFRLIHATRMPANRANASGSIIEKYHQESVDSGSRIRDGLAAAVAYSMQTVANGLLSHQANASLVDKLRKEPARADELHQNLLRWVYRTLFVLVIEERVLHHAPTATLRQRQLYRDYYSLQRLRRLADRPQLADRRSHDLWRAMHQTLRLYEDGGKGLPLGIAPLGSFLFREEGLQHLFQYQVDNRALLQALNRLSTFTHPDTNVRMRVNYGALDVEEFGSVYESLLELRPRIIPEGEKLTFSYAQLAGNERKTSGSYYTPDSLVQCLLDSALDPLVEERLAGKSGEEAEKALLAIKVCDPAVGSGHFIIGAAHRLAQCLADIRAGEEALSPEVQRHALRDVVSHCLYGVDINPLSVELCKVSLWMLAMEPGKSLGFLDHHIQCGNSLLGATPRVLAGGLPDEAFKPLAGDDADICKEAKKRNADERKQLALFHGNETAPWERLGSLPAAMLAVGTMSDDTADTLLRKEQKYVELVRSTDYLHSRFLADAWSAAFVWKKTRDLPYPITNDILRKIERNPHDCAPWMREEIERLRDRYQFFHWHLAFPEIFPVLDKDHRPVNELTGWNGGFDLILGNPPWEHVELKEKEWFAEREPAIANAATGSKRKKMIAALAESAPSTFSEFCDAVRFHDGIAHLLAESGCFPLCGGGRLNTYAVFAESMRHRLTPVGRLGCVLPSGIATDDTTKLFFQSIVDTDSLVSLYDFENRANLFPAVDSRMKFCLLTAGSGIQPIADHADFVFFAHQPEHLTDPQRRFTLSRADIELLNPNTRTCPGFRSRRDAEICKSIYRRLPILIRVGPPTENPWALRIRRIFNMGIEEISAYAKTEAQLVELGIISRRQHEICTANGETFVAMFEGKMFDAFSSRAAGVIFNPANLQRGAQSIEATLADLHNPDFSPRSLYWYPKKQLEGLHPPSSAGRWLLGFKDVASATNERSMLASILPYSATNFSVRVVQFISETNGRRVAAFLGCINSFPFDYLLRQSLGGLHVSDYITQQVTVPSPDIFERSCEWSERGQLLKDWLLPRVLELTYTSWDLEPFAQDCGLFGPPFVWDETRRFQIRCELDAAFFHLYGLNREDAAYILDTFPIVRRKDIAATDVKDTDGNIVQEGTYRTKDTILALYDQFAEAQRTGTAFSSPLNLPPGDVRACHRKRKIAILAFGSLRNDPGKIGGHIKFRIKTDTPFPVEYGRRSKTRGGGPTLVPRENGAKVEAELLILPDEMTVARARDLLWLRERGKEDSGETYSVGIGSDHVLVREWTECPWVETVLYTDFNPLGKETMTAEALAQAAIKSAAIAAEGKDGITYLAAAKEAGIQTQLTNAYVEAILRETGANSLTDALIVAKTGKLPDPASAVASDDTKPGKKPRNKVAKAPAPELDLGLNVFDQPQE